MSQNPALPKQMQAATVNAGKVSWTATAVPSCGAGEVLIKVAFAGINRADLMQKAGHYPAPPGASSILGLEVSGTVVACGTQVPSSWLEQEVCALLAGGGYAEYVAVPVEQVLAKPTDLSLASAAGITEVFATVYYNLFMLAQLQAGEKVLVHAGASGVGSAAVQLLHSLKFDCFVTVGSDHKLQWCKTLGASAGWNRREGDFVNAVKTWGGADVILDPVAGDYLQWNQQVLNNDGRLVVIGLLGGRSCSLDAGRLLMKRQRIIGSTLRNQPLAVKAEIMQGLAQLVWPRFNDEDIQLPEPQVFHAAAVERAHEQLQGDDNCGKLVLDMSFDK